MINALELLNSIKETAIENNISEPFIVGGIPRDIAFGKRAYIKDIDITTGNNQSLALAAAVSNKWKNANFKLFEDNHSSLIFKNVQIDFSNNYNLPGIEKLLNDIGINSPTLLQKEMYSRDFTINTLLKPLDLQGETVDITGLGLEDIKNKILRTPVNPDYTIGYDPRRILRALKLVVKYDLIIDDELQKSILKYRGNVREVPYGQIKKQINEMLKINSNKTLDLLTKFKLLPLLPLSKLLTTEIIKHHMVQNILDDGV